MLKILCSRVFAATRRDVLRLVPQAVRAPAARRRQWLLGRGAMVERAIHRFPMLKSNRARFFAHSRARRPATRSRACEAPAATRRRAPRRACLRARARAARCRGATASRSLTTRSQTTRSVRKARFGSTARVAAASCARRRVGSRRRVPRRSATEVTAGGAAAAGRGARAGGPGSTTPTRTPEPANVTESFAFQRAAILDNGYSEMTSLLIFHPFEPALVVADGATASPCGTLRPASAARFRNSNSALGASQAEARRRAPARKARAPTQPPMVVRRRGCARVFERSPRR